MAAITSTRASTGMAGRAPGRDKARDAEFTAYVAARQGHLLRTAYLLSGDAHTAEDLVQTALAKLYLSWHRVQQREALDAYVRRILVNENSSLWRRAWKRREHTTAEPPERAGTQDHYDEGRSGVLWRFVQSLPPRQRAVVVLRYYEELSEAETADALGISVGTVKSQTSRALAALRDRAPRELDPRELDPRDLDTGAQEGDR